MDGRGRGARDGSPRHSPRCCAGASTRTRSTPARPRSASAPRRAAWMPQPAAGASRPSKSGSHPQATCVRLSLFWSATHSAPTQGIHARDTRLRSSTATKQRCHRHTTRTSPAATLSPLWAAHERYRSTLGLTALSHKTLTHTRNVRRCTYEISHRGRDTLGCTRGSPASGPAVRGAATQRYTLRGSTCSPSVLVVAGTGPTAATWHARAVRVRDVASLSGPALRRSRRHLLCPPAVCCCRRRSSSSKGRCGRRSTLTAQTARGVP